MENSIKINENYFENIMLNDEALLYTLTIPKGYVDKGLNINITLNGKEIYNQLIKIKEEV